MKRIKYLSGFGLIVILMFSNCKQNYDDLLTSSLVKKSYVPVEVESIQQSTSIIPIYAIGRVASDTETKLSFKTGGYIAELTAGEGDFVRTGRLLGRLRTQEIDAQVLKANHALMKARRDLVRIEAMYTDSVATLENVQDLRTLVEVSQADLDIALYNQKHSQITSPVTGRVLRKLAEPNELVNPGQPIYIIGSFGRGAYVMTIQISDRDINLISLGTRASLTFDAFEGSEFSARVSQIAENADPVTGTFEIELEIANANQRLRNGLIGRVTLFPGAGNDYVKIPISSIVEGVGRKISVFVPTQSDSIAKKIELQIERFADDFVWVRSEYFSEDRIITTGAPYLKDGQLIKIN